MLVQNGIRDVTWASEPHVARLPWTPGLARPANPRLSASAASSRIGVRLLGTPMTERAGRRVIGRNRNPRSVQDSLRSGLGDTPHAVAALHRYWIHSPLSGIAPMAS